MKKGFTIMELLVVISILVILIGIAIPRFKGMQDTARVAQAKKELQTMQSAIESYYMNQPAKMYPASSSTIAADVLTSQVPQMISAAPYDPFGATATTEYNYILTSDNNNYVVYSKGAAGNGSVSIVNGGTVTVSNGALCVTNGSGC